MALPNLNNTPQYDVTIPSTGKKTRYRPYLVAEEKLLLLALEEGSDVSIAKATLSLIEACVDDIDAFNLTATDVEYLFLKLRSKSVGETTLLAFKCGTCEGRNDVSVNINNVEMPEYNSADNMIQISDDYIVEMRPMKYKDIIDRGLIGSSSKNMTETFYNIIRYSLYALHTEDEKILFSEEEESEVILFLNNMTTAQFSLLRKYVENLPSIEELVEFNCSDCGNKNVVTIKGLHDFF